MKLFSKQNGLLALASLALFSGAVSVALAQAPAAPTPAPAPAPAASITAPASSITAPASPVQAGLPSVNIVAPPSDEALKKVQPAASSAPANQKSAGAASGKEKAGSAPGTPATGAVAGQRVTDILAQPAAIRALPEKYLVVKKTQDADDVGSRLMAARTALAQGSYQAALAIFSDLYRDEPRNGRVLVGRAIALQKLGQKDEALAAYELALSNDPKNLEALTNMLGLLDTADRASAIERLHRLRDIYPSNADITAQLGLVYGAAGDHDKSLKYFDMANALKPGDVNILYNRAVVYDRMGKSNQAADLYRQIVLLAAEGSLDQAFPIETVKQRLSVIR